MPSQSDSRHSRVFRARRTTPIAGLVALLTVAEGQVVTGSLVTGQGAELGQGPYRSYKRWDRMNDVPVFSETHGQSFVVTYVNPVGVRAALAGTFPFPVGTVIVKESFESDGCKPGAPGAVVVMEKRFQGYDPASGDWHWVRYGSNGILWGEGTGAGRMGFCAVCHRTARVNDYVFGNGTRIKARATLPPVPCQ